MRATPEEAESLGRELVRQRDQGVPWKVLAWRYGLCRARLNQLWLAAIARGNQPEDHREPVRLEPSATSPLTSKCPRKE